MANRTTYNRVNDGYADDLKGAVFAKFGTKISLTFDMVTSEWVVKPTEKKRLSAEEKTYIEAFRVGYTQAARRMVAT